MEEILVFGFLIGLTSGVLAGIIANARGLSTGLYFFLGFFFPLIGILAAAVASPTPGSGKAKVKLTSQKEALRRGEIKECPHCFSLIDIRASVCRFCRRDVGL